MNEQSYGGIKLTNVKNSHIAHNTFTNIKNASIEVIGGEKTVIHDNQFLWTEEKLVTLDAIRSLLKKVNRYNDEAEKLITQLENEKSQENFFKTLGNIANVSAVGTLIHDLLKPLL